MNKISGEELCRRYDSLGKDHCVLKSVWEQCLQFYMPEAQGLIYGDKSEGEREQPFDFTGVHSVSRLSSGLFSNTVSMGDEFFGFRCGDEDLQDNEEVNNYFTEAAKVTLRHLQDSNFPLESYEMMTYYCALQTGVFYTEWDDEESKLSFSNFPISSCRIAEDHNGRVRTIYREFELSAESVLSKFGDKTPQKIRSKAHNSNERYEPVKIFHAVFKNPKIEKTSKGTRKAISTNKEWLSFYVYIEEKEIIEEGGFDTFPYAIPRFFKKAGTAYGRGPAFSALPALRELNALRADMLDGIELGVQPPVLIPEGIELDDVDLSPGSIIPISSNSGAPQFWQSTINLRDAAEHRKSVVEEVKDLFYVDLFMMLEEQKNMTATEVQERVAEKVQAITPVITRLYDEFFSEVIGRCFQLLVDNEKIEPLPKQLAGKSYSVSYTTKLDNKLKSLDTNQIMMAMQAVSQLSQLSQVDPDFKHIVKIEEAYKRIFQNHNVDPDLLYTKEEYEKGKADEAAAMEKAQMTQELMGKVSLAPIDLQQMEEGQEQFSPLAELMPGG